MDQPVFHLFRSNLTCKDFALFDELVKKAKESQNKIPTKSNRIERLGVTPELKAKIVEHAKGTRVLVHPQVPVLIEAFIQHKRECGSDVEKAFYSTLTCRQFIQRTIEKRPIVFFTDRDHTVLRDNGARSLDSLREAWLKVGKRDEGRVRLEDYMSYDELLISALLGVSVPTLFINTGSRMNIGKAQQPGTFQEEGILVGLVGARLDVMESLQCIIKKDHPAPGSGSQADPNKPETKLSRLWARFYHQGPKGGPYFFPTYEDVEKEITQTGTTKKYYKLPGHTTYFNIDVYKRRMRYTIEIFLSDANDRAAVHGGNKKAYCHIVGLGLGVWEFIPKQGEWLVETFSDALSQQAYPHISDIDFSWFPESVNKCGQAKHGEIRTENYNNIKIHFSRRDPAAKLPEDKLLVAMYAWDSNSFPGNEFWIGKLSASGDPAAACCSTIGELQNPNVNTGFSTKFWPPIENK